MLHEGFLKKKLQTKSRLNSILMELAVSRSSGLTVMITKTSFDG